MMFAACMSLCKDHFKQRIHALTVTVALALTGVAAVLVAMGFGLSLLYVWLQQIYGTMPALAIVAGGFAGFGVMLFLIAWLRPARRSQALHRAPVGAIGSGEQTIDDAVAAVQGGSRETMLAALALALVTGVTLGRKL